MGIEPTSLQSQYNILPLNYYHLLINYIYLQKKGFEPLFLGHEPTDFPLVDILECG